MQLFFQFVSIFAILDRNYADHLCILHTASMHPVNVAF